MKHIALLLAALLVFSLTGCSQMRRRQAVWFIPVESE